MKFKVLKPVKALGKYPEIGSIVDLKKNEPELVKMGVLAPIDGKPEPAKEPEKVEPEPNKVKEKAGGKE